MLFLEIFIFSSWHSFLVGIPRKFRPLRKHFGFGGGCASKKPVSSREMVSRHMPEWACGQWICIETKSLTGEVGIVVHSLWSDRIQKARNIQILHGEHGPTARVTGLSEFREPHEDIRRDRQRKPAESAVRDFLGSLVPDYEWKIEFKD